MTATTWAGHLLGPDTHTNRPSASSVPDGALYMCTTHNKIYKVVSAAWTDYATLSGQVATDTIWDAKGDLVVGSGADAAAILSAGSDGQVLTLDAAQTLGVKWASAPGGGIGAILSDTSITGATGTFDITSLSGSYGRLVCHLFARTDETITISTCNGRFNNDSSSIYYWADQNFDSTNGQGTTHTEADSRFAYGMPGASAPSNSFGYLRVEMMNYATASYLKQGTYSYGLRLDTNRTKTGSAQVHYASTTAISRIAFAPGTSGKSFVTGSRLIIEAY